MKRILVADDHETVRSGLRALIEARHGWEVVGEAHDGRQALAVTVETQPDVAILDYSMPFMTGVEVARHIRDRLLLFVVFFFLLFVSLVLVLLVFGVGVFV